MFIFHIHVFTNYDVNSFLQAVYPGSAVTTTMNTDTAEQTIDGTLGQGCIIHNLLSSTQTTPISHLHPQLAIILIYTQSHKFISK